MRSYKTDSKLAARRDSVRAFWIAQPTVCAQVVAKMFGISKDTAHAMRPTSIAYAKPQKINGATTKKTTQDALTISLYLEDLPLDEIAKLTGRSIKTTKKVVQQNNHKEQQEYAAATNRMD